MPTDHTPNRNEVIRRLREELVGPPAGNIDLDCSQPITFESYSDADKFWREKGSNQEILRRDPPCKRYGIGVLYPEKQADNSGGAEDAAGALPGEEAEQAPSAALSEKASESLEEILKRTGGSRKEEGDSEDFEISTANTYKPSGFGVSFLAELPDDATLIVEVTGGRYHKLPVVIGAKESIWWRRSPVTIRAEYAATDLKRLRRGKVAHKALSANNTEGMDLKIEAFSRPYPNDARLLTICLLNRMHVDGQLDEYCLFQSELKVQVISKDGKPHILPYPKPPFRKLDDEEQSLALLYCRSEAFATGHGCAAGWKTNPDSSRAFHVSAESMPYYETASITPEILREDKSPVEVSMATLAGLVAGDDGFSSLDEVVSLYEDWIRNRRKQIPLLNSDYQPAANRHMKDCEDAAGRMRTGLAYLKSDPKAKLAFQLANHAMLLQQIQTSPITRNFKFTPSTLAITFDAPYKLGDPLAGGKRGKWRPFQIAFLLMSLKSTADDKAADRRKVELIWFPTGGGKTEAYLGLAAFGILFRRLTNPNDTGTHALMRYTLRLLTAQQFQRASGLICALEHLRRKRKDIELGTEEFSIGIWLGSETTPNRRADAQIMLRDLQKRGIEADNGFLVDRCPWCRAKIGPHNEKGPKEKVFGYRQAGDTVSIFCTDKQCEFHTSLPIYVIDEDLYAKRPSLVIGTVDKFATLAWNPNARTLFGINKQGTRIASPPGLIIQDELHLISGPLGTMVGLYESVIEDLCTDHRQGKALGPKIVCSTATIRRYTQQVLDLFGREDTALFPPPGLDIDNSFFSRYAANAAGEREAGRIYVGVHAPGLGSLQTAQVRTFAALLQAPMSLPTWPERDPWWTLLMFYNSLRELGTSISLFQSDIPDYLNTIWKRYCIGPSTQRILNTPLELTGRLRSDEVPQAIKSLEKTSDDPRNEPVDCCLSSSIIEVGVDIDRLSLLCIVGQPKTTSQYIQVAGRVGRNWKERPGLVVTIYGASKPRDRSHFEKFRSYHERLYAQVEPTSVTPFSLPALDRALHAVMAAYVRQNGDELQAESPSPFPQDLMRKLESILLARVQTINKKGTNPEQEEHLKNLLTQKCDQWRRWGKRFWDKVGDEDAPLLYRAGSYIKPEDKPRSWSTPNSMRNVDASCEIAITKL